MRPNNQAAKQSARYPFIAEHRGGPLSKQNHRRLMGWARECARRVLPLIKTVDSRLIYALQVAEHWEKNKVPTGVAMKASLAAHAVARESSDAVEIAVARSIGQGVATAHMADHSMGAALYALRALNRAGKAVEEEREWQRKSLQKILPADVASLVLKTMTKKAESFKM
ncbi:putative immunity protein [Paradesertivirga mongoliensis]|uniref:Immunity protein n=1 Tax=Paradesertivirga mongoliensis TaxID=2100740 RepID=A0ABW4ZHL0_9SPHI|nr:hypothetical protein [Pedobacter mongoliensis]